MMTQQQSGRLERSTQNQEEQGISHEEMRAFFITLKNHESKLQQEGTKRLDARYPDQNPLTVEQLSELAHELLNHPAIIFIFETHGKPTAKRAVKVLAQILNEIFSREKSAKGLHPFSSEYVRELVTVLFTCETKLSREQVYEVLGKAGIYGLIHRFCTQSVPVGTKVDFAGLEQKSFREIRRRGARGSLFSDVVRYALPKIGIPVLPESTSELLKPEQKEGEPQLKQKEWISNDKETRIQIAEEMFHFIKGYIKDNPGTQKISIIEPGAGNGEFTAILAKMLYEDEDQDPKTTTRGKVLLILREYQQGMIDEGKVKLQRLADSLGCTTQELGICYIKGSADVPLQTQIEEIKALLAKNDSKHDEQLKTKYSLTRDDAQFLIDNHKGPAVAAVSTFTFGAMGSIASGIVATTVNDVAKNGQCWFVDFANKPPTEALLELLQAYAYIPEGTDAEEITAMNTKLLEIFELFGKIGFATALELIYKFWGHDSDQVWNVFEKLKGMGVKLTSELELTVFGFLFLGETSVPLPGYLQVTLRTGGNAPTNN